MMNYPISVDVWLDGEFLLSTTIENKKAYGYLEYLYDAWVGVTINKGNVQEIRMFSKMRTDRMFV